MKEQSKNKEIGIIIGWRNSKTLAAIARPDLEDISDCDSVDYPWVVSTSSIEDFVEMCTRIEKPIMIRRIGGESQFKEFGDYFVEIEEDIEG